jgi:hypothetical protein
VDNSDGDIYHQIPRKILVQNSSKKEIPVSVIFFHTTT